MLSEEKKIFDIREAELPRGYAKDVAVKLNVPVHTVYNVRLGFGNNRRVKLELLRLALSYQEESNVLDVQIKDTEKRIVRRKYPNQLSMF